MARATSPLRCQTFASGRPRRTPVSPPKPPSATDLASRLEDNGRFVDREYLDRVFRYSAEMHKDQVRRSGEPYMTHPLNVALILAGMNMDLVCLQTGLLHDVIEDTGTSHEDLRREFGEDVAHCVDGVTKLGKVKFYSPEERQAESVRKMLLAMVSDIRVILVKLADRLHNMMTLDAMAPEARRRISQEALEIYAPLANRLGMAKVKGDLRTSLSTISIRCSSPP